VMLLMGVDRLVPENVESGRRRPHWQASDSRRSIKRLNEVAIRDLKKIVRIIEMIMKAMY